MKASNNFDWRFITDSDYAEILIKWWDDWGWTPPDPDALSKNGIIISKNGVDLYAGFIYYTGTSVALVEWIVSNKNAPIEYKKGALERMMDIMSILTKEKGVKTLFTTTSLPTLKNSLKKSGFEVTDEGNYHLIKKT